MLKKPQTIIHADHSRKFPFRMHLVVLKISSKFASLILSLVDRMTIFWTTLHLRLRLTSSIGSRATRWCRSTRRLCRHRHRR